MEQFVTNVPFGTLHANIDMESDFFYFPVWSFILYSLKWWKDGNCHAYPGKITIFLTQSSSVSLIPFVLLFVYQDPLVPALLFLSFLLGTFSGVSRAICFLFALKEVTKFKLFKSTKRHQGNMFVSVLIVIIASAFKGTSFSVCSAFANCSEL